jgi:hypothetical protein
MTLPRSSTSAPPELPGWMGALIWKCRASSCAPARLAISPLVKTLLPAFLFEASQQPTNLIADYHSSLLQ